MLNYDEVLSRQVAENDQSGHARKLSDLSSLLGHISADYAKAEAEYYAANELAYNSLLTEYPTLAKSSDIWSKLIKSRCEDQLYQLKLCENYFKSISMAIDAARSNLSAITKEKERTI